MTFSKDQVEALKAGLNRSRVRTRKQAGRDLSYIEGWHAIAEANRIFGFDAWDRETVDLRPCGEPRQVEGRWRVAFIARVRIVVRPQGQLDPAWWVKREGTGYGSGIDRDLGQAFESAVKEAETDAMKRALMTFGNPFGLALYDKDQTNVVDGPPSSSEEENEDDPAVIERKLKTKIDAASTINAVTDLMLSDQTQGDLAMLAKGIRDQVRDHAKKRLHALGWPNGSKRGNGQSHEQQGARAL